MGAFPFESNKVIDVHISDADLRVFDAGFDQNTYRLKPLAEVIIRALPEFAFGYNPTGTSDSKIIDRLKDAAESLYKTDLYKSRGEFGELILHLLLRDFCNTIPLISKIFFKDTDNASVHGFDAVHVVDDGDKKSLWLGEAKIYQDGAKGISELASDLTKHFSEDYLRSEFVLIRKKLELLDQSVVTDKDYWLDLMHKHTTIDKVFTSITIPMLCVYDSEIYSSHTEVSEKYIFELTNEAKKLKDDFKKKTISTTLNVVLLLLPIPSKEDLVEMLHNKLKNIQNI